jgi:hypothetical protein
LQCFRHSTPATPTYQQGAQVSAVFKRVGYRDLNSRQQEAFNFQKVSAVLADYGFTTIRLSSDWRGADFIAHTSMA